MQAEPDLSLVQEEPWVGVIILSRRSVSDHVRASFWIHQRNVSYLSISTQSTYLQIAKLFEIPLNVPCACTLSVNQMKSIS